MAIVEGLIKPWAKHQSKKSTAQVLKQSVKGTDLAKKQAVKNHLSKVNGKLNGNGNGNGLRNGLEETTVDLNYKPSDNFVKADREKRINTSPVYTFNNWQANKPTKLTDITEWNSEFDVNTKEHLLDFGKAVKYIFPGKVGEENFYDFGEIHKLYENLGFSRTKNGIKYNVQLGKGSYSSKNKYAGGPVVGTKQTELRRANQRISGKTRTQRIKANGYSSQADIDHFDVLGKQVEAGNKRIFEETGIKPKGTTGYVLEHNIPQSSRYWDVHTSSKNSDIVNTFVWNNPRFVNFKGNVEEFLKKIPGEPFTTRMNGTLNEMEIIYIDTGEVLDITLELGDDYKTIFKQLLKYYN